MKSKQHTPKVLEQDPNLEQEALKYAEPIVSREFILTYLKSCEAPQSFHELHHHFQITAKDQQRALKRRLRAMERDGQLIFTRRKKYAIPDKINLLTGTVTAGKDGFGFLWIDNQKYVLSPRDMRKLYPGDKIAVRTLNDTYKGAQEVSLVEILERNTQEIVCRIEQGKKTWLAIPLHKHLTQEIILEADPSKNLVGAIVSVKITEFATRNSPAFGKVKKILGKDLDYNLVLEATLKNFKVPYKWNKELRAEAASIPEHVRTVDLKNRCDLRELPLVTIDGENAKDFDDAVYCAKLKNGGFNLIVAIADVSHYVKIGSELDKEAYLRGTSVYFPGKVVPMLPEKLSNGICSLKPGVDRLCLVCDLKVSKTGEVDSYQFYPAVMHSHARLTYNKVAKILYGKDAKLTAQYSYLGDALLNLDELYQVLMKARSKRGAIEFDAPEYKITFTKGKKVAAIDVVMRNDAHRIIEECMLLANVAAANFITKHKLAGMFRNHELPTAQKQQDLHNFLAFHGISLPKKQEIDTKDLQKILVATQDSPYARIIQTMILRSMAQAHYAEQNVGHFGLAYVEYTHFTSPIRRYPDLWLHRQIHFLLHSDKRFTKYKSHNFTARELKLYKHATKNLAEVAEQCSLNERRAEDATRDFIQWLKCEYMADHVGVSCQGVISAITSFGMFVLLDDYNVEGLVHISQVGAFEYFDFDATSMQLIGELSKTCYKIGDKLIVRVDRVNKQDRFIDLSLIKSLEKKAKAKAKPKKRAATKNKKGKNKK